MIKHISDLFRARRARVPLAAGQISSYRTRPHKQSSRAILERIEQDRDGSAVIHLRLTQLSVKNAAGKVVATELQHAPIAQEAFFRSGVALEAQGAAPASSEGYRLWRESYERWEAGVYSVTLAEIVAPPLHVGIKGIFQILQHLYNLF